MSQNGTAEVKNAHSRLQWFLSAASHRSDSRRRSPDHLPAVRDLRRLLPIGCDMDHTPRQLFAMIRAGMQDEVLRSNTPWFCVSCYYCMVRCPQGDPHHRHHVHPEEHGGQSQSCMTTATAPDWSETFVGFVENYGRSFEFGLATRYHLTHYPLKNVGLGLSA